jgi:hypothetical protein
MNVNELNSLESFSEFRTILGRFRRQRRFPPLSLLVCRRNLRIAHDDLCPPLQLQFLPAFPSRHHEAGGHRAGARRLADSLIFTSPRSRRRRPPARH